MCAANACARVPLHPVKHFDERVCCDLGIGIEQQYKVRRDGCVARPPNVLRGLGVATRNPNICEGKIVAPCKTKIGGRGEKRYLGKITVRPFPRFGHGWRCQQQYGERTIGWALRVEDAAQGVA